MDRSPKTQHVFNENNKIRLTPLMRKQGSTTIVKPSAQKRVGGKKSVASSMEFQAKFDRNYAQSVAASAVTTSSTAGTHFGAIINNEKLS